MTEHIFLEITLVMRVDLLCESTCYASRIAVVQLKAHVTIRHGSFVVVSL